jgi:hypothetical protein
MKRFVIAMTLLFVLALTMIVQGQAETAKWEHANIQWDQFVGWTWNEPTVFAEGEEINDLCRELSIEIPANKDANLYAVVNWAGRNGWELVAMDQRVGFIAGWLKRKN